MLDSNPAKEHRLNYRRILRRMLMVVVTLLLITLSWGALSGGVRQLARAVSVGQQIETTVQLAFGLLSLLIVPTYLWWRRWGKPLQVAWILSFVVAAGLSALVWGQPMPLVAIFFAAAALSFALALLWALRISLEP